MTTTMHDVLRSDLNDVERLAHTMRMKVSVWHTRVPDVQAASLDADVNTAYGILLNVESKLIEMLGLTSHDNMDG